MAPRWHGGTRSVAAAAFGAFAAGAVGLTALRYRRYLRAARARLASTERHSLITRFGNIEYAERGAGDPILISHGIFQGCDVVLMFRDLVPDRRMIAPSRFGYLGSDMPPRATPADQAGAFVELLDALGIPAIDVIGISAGATSTLQMALLHPGRVRHLVLLSANLPGSATAVVQPAWTRALNRQVPIWLLKTFFPRLMARMAGVPNGLAMSEADAAFVAAFLDGMFPIDARVRGIDFDAFVSNADVNDYDLSALSVPALLVHAKDDPMVSYTAAERAVGRIRGARLISLPSGGHHLLGQMAAVRDHIDAFLRVPVA